MPTSMRVTGLRLIATLLALAALLAAACSGDSGSPTSTPVRSPAARPPATEAPRPAGIPPEAQFVATDTVFGGVGAPDSARPQLFAVACKDGVLAVVTSQIVELYAALPCDRAVPQQVADRFVGHPVTLRIAFTDVEKLYVDSPSIGSIEFTVSGAWVKQ